MSCLGRGGRAAGPTPSHEIIGQLNCASVGPLNCQTGSASMPTMDCSPGGGAGGGEFRPSGGDYRQSRQSGASAMPRPSAASRGSTNFNDPCASSGDQVRTSRIRILRICSFIHSLIHSFIHSFAQ